MNLLGYKNNEMNGKITQLLLYLMLLSGLILRYKSIWFGYPLIIHPDEPTLINTAAKILKNVDLNPHFFNYPSLIIYLQSLVIPRVHFFLAGRIIASIFSVISLYVVYLIGRKLANDKAGIFAAFTVAISPLHITNSAYVTTDIWVAIFLTFILFFSLKIYEEDKLSNYLFAGLFVGLAMGSKYTAFIFFSSVLLAHLLSKGFNFKQFFERNIILSSITAIVIFLITTPFAILDYKEFLKDLIFEGYHYRNGHIGSEAIGNTSWDLYFNYLLSSSGVGYIILFLVLLSLIFLFKKQYRVLLIVAIPPLLFFFFVGSYKVYFPRNIVSLVPALAILAATSLYLIFNLFLNKPHYKKYINPLYITLALIVAFPLVNKAISDIQNKNLPNTRWESISWIKDNIPAGSKLAIVAYGPPVKTYIKQLKVLNLGIPGTKNYDHSSKFDDSVQYIVMSSGSYGRFFDKNGKPKPQFKKQAKFYINVFAHHKLLYELHPKRGILAGPTIKVFKVK